MSVKTYESPETLQTGEIVRNPKEGSTQLFLRVTELGSNNTRAKLRFCLKVNIGTRQGSSEGLVTTWMDTACF